MPVIFWACINMRKPVIGPSWKLSDSGRTFTWISNEHCMLLVGYDEEGYYFNDPYENHGVIRYPKKLVEDRHAAQYRMAVGLHLKQSKTPRQATGYQISAPYSPSNPAFISCIISNKCYNTTWR